MIKFSVVYWLKIWKKPIVWCVFVTTHDVTIQNNSNIFQDLNFTEIDVNSIELM
jgi:hypothetical protein